MKLTCLPFAVFTKKIAVAATILSMCGMVNLAQAGIIDTSNDSFIDQDTGLEWMDFGINNQYTYNEVTGMLGAGELYDGWRLATQEETTDLYINAFVSNSDEVYDQRNTVFMQMTSYAYNLDDTNGSFGPSGLEPIFDIMGYNFGNASATQYGYGLFEQNSNTLGAIRFSDYHAAADNDSTNLYLRSGSISETYRDNTSELLSTMLVRGATDVPEPSSLAIFALGIMVLAFRNNKKRAFKKS